MLYRETKLSIKARSIALLILNKLSDSNCTLDIIVENNSGEFNKLSVRDKALSNQIIYGVIRWRNRLDLFIDVLSKIPRKSISLVVLNIIRIGLFQLFFMDRIPYFAIVSTSVDLAKSNLFSKKASGYINAILRNAIRNPALKDYSLSLKEESLDELTFIKSFPKWILSRWLKRFGYKETCSICDIINIIPSIIVRVNTLKTTKKDLKILLSKEVSIIKNCNFIPNALSIAKINRSINEMKTFSKGFFSVQDGSAQIVSHILSPKPGETILDACTGFGNKAAHIAQLMQNKGKIIAIDNIKSKLIKLAMDSKRLGIKIIQTQKLDLNIKPDSSSYCSFDRILLDAPCSGLGTIRRNPDIKWSSSIKKILNCSNKQIHLLNNVSLMVKKLGIIAYAVCSTEPEENEYVINSFLKKNKNFKVQKNTSTTKYLTQCLEEDGFFRIYPHIHGMDGFFVALLKREY